MSYKWNGNDNKGDKGEVPRQNGRRISDHLRTRCKQQGLPIVVDSGMKGDEINRRAWWCIILKVVT